MSPTMFIPAQTGDNARRVHLKGILAEHFASDDVGVDLYRHNYECAVNVLTHPEKFPKANFEKLEAIVDAMFEHDPSATLGY